MNEFSNAAILFFKIANFDEYYEEQFKRGAGCISVLHKIVCRFDDLLSRPQYCSLEKIKMIGSCLMVASGVSSPTDSNGNRAIAENDDLPLLVQFGLEAADVVHNFNNENFGVFHNDFRFTMSAGIDCGPAMAGIVGSSRLLFDVWGDTVNMASRMCSKSLLGKLQVTVRVRNRLQSSFQFERRENVSIRGLDRPITTYLIDLTSS
jgi:adenylate cyclase 9